MAAILHAFTRFLDGGLERNAVHFATVQRALGHEVQFIVGRDERKGIDHSFTVRRLPELARAPHPVRDVVAYFELRRVLSTLHADVLHTHHAKVGLLARAASRKRQVVKVHTFHGWSFGPQFGPVAWAYRRLEQRAAAWTDWLVAVGEELREVHLRAGIGTADRFVVLRSPIEVDRLLEVRQSTDAMREGARESLGLPTQARVILWIGRLEAPKRPIELLHWLRDTLLAEPDVRLVFRGAGPLEQEIPKVASRLGIGGSVRVDGPGDIVEHLHGANVVAVSSDSEGMPQVVIQALAAGLPVVATDVCGLREISGADITIVDRSGEGFGASLQKSLASGLRRLVSPQALDPWRVERVDAEIRAFDELMGIGTKG